MTYQPKYNNSYALVIALDNYRDPSFAPLGEAEKDARELAALLAEPEFGFQVKSLMGEQATKAAILEALFELQSAEPDDRILVYFAGHGYTLTDQFGAETGYMACFETRPQRHFTALELEDITDLRRRTPAKHVLFVFDACFSGQALGLTRSASVTERLLERRAYQVLSAGAGDQTVADYDSMTDHVIEHLRREHVSTLNSLGLYVQQRMAASSNHMQIPQFGHLQGSQGGDFVFEAEPDFAKVYDGVTDLPPARQGSQSPPILWIVGTFLASLVLIAGGFAIGNARGPTPPQITPTPVIIAETEQQRQQVSQVRDALLLYDREFRFALETGNAEFIGLAATGRALAARLEAIRILQQAGDCRWAYTHRGIQFERIEFLSDTQVEVRATVDRDGTVFCGISDPVERPEFAFEGPLHIRYELQRVSQRWLVEFTEEIE